MCPGLHCDTVESLIILSIGCLMPNFSRVLSSGLALPPKKRAKTQKGPEPRPSTGNSLMNDEQSGSLVCPCLSFRVLQRRYSWSVVELIHSSASIASPLHWPSNNGSRSSSFEICVIDSSLFAGIT